MKRFLRTSIIIIALGLAVSCSEQKFSSIPSDTCSNLNDTYGDNACVTDPATGLNVLSYEVGSCKADILFVVDNSGSMYSEQLELANRFPSLLSAISSLDYHIAVTTTDVSSSPNNYDPNNVELLARQDGRLIKFPDGKKFLTKSTPNAQSAFEKTVKREETIQCEAGDHSACASDDERGIYAVNYALNTAQQRGNLGTSSFFRPDSYLAIVFISDENERSDAGLSTSNSLYKPVHEDTPQSLIDSVTGVFGKSKIFSAYPIVIQSRLTYANQNGDLYDKDDTSCHAQQLAQASTSRPDLIRYGTWYELLSLGTKGSVDGTSVTDLGGLVPGYADSICKGNYSNTLTEIGKNIAKYSQTTTKLSCVPEELSVSIGGVKLDSSEYTLNGTQLQWPATCEKVKVTYKCPTNI